jgi:hypothetical protein
MPRTVTAERVRRSIEARRRQFAGTSASAAASTPASGRKKKRKSPKKRKTKRKRKSTTPKSKTTSSTSLTSTTTIKKKRKTTKRKTTKRKTTKRRKSTKGKGKGKGKGKSSSSGSKAEKTEKGSSAKSRQSLSLFGSSSNLDFCGDDGENDDLYSNPYPSTSSGIGQTMSRERATEIVSKKPEKKSVGVDEHGSGSDMLANIMSSQKATLSSPSKSGSSEKMKEVYTRPKEDKKPVVKRSISNITEKMKDGYAKRPKEEKKSETKMPISSGSDCSREPTVKRTFTHSSGSDDSAKENLAKKQKINISVRVSPMFI